MTLKMYTYSRARDSHKPRTPKSRFSTSRVLTRSQNKPQDHTIAERFEAGNTSSFRFLGLCAFGLLCFVVVGMLFGDYNAQASGNRGLVYSNFTEITKFIKKTPDPVAPGAAQTTPVLHEYVVKSGDTVMGICSSLQVNCDEFKALNQLVYPYSVGVGQVLKYKVIQ